MSVGEWHRFRDATREEQVAILSDMSPIDLLKLDTQFALWAARGQLEPSGEWWATWLMMAGRGFGKTRAGAEWVLGLARMRDDAMFDVENWLANEVATEFARAEGKAFVSGTGTNQRWGS